MESAPDREGNFESESDDIYTDLEDQVTDPETEAAIHDCLLMYAKNGHNLKRFSKFLKCLSDYVNFDTLKKYMYS